MTRARVVAMMFAAAAPAAGCASRAVTAPVAAEDLAGCYGRVDRSGYNLLALALRPDLTYTATLQGDLGSWGDASGRWRVDGSTLVLTPTQETEQLTGFLRAPTIRRQTGRYALDVGHGWEPLSRTGCRHVGLAPDAAETPS